jgi:hypothetical protein
MPVAASARSSYPPTPSYAGPRKVVLLGHIASLKPSGARVVLRLDQEYLA